MLKAIWMPPSIGRVLSRSVADVAKGCIGTIVTAVRGTPSCVRATSTARKDAVLVVPEIGASATPTLSRFAISSMSSMTTPGNANKLRMRACHCIS